MDLSSKFTEIAALAIAVHGLAVVIVNMTPTPKDNKQLSDLARFVVRGYRVIELAAGIVSKRAKQ